MHLILPKSHPDLEALRHLPLFFLVGPTSGGGDWHRGMTNLLVGHVGDCIVVNPSWDYDQRHPHYQYRMHSERQFPHALDFELHYIDQAASLWDRGCVIGWLGCESKESPRQDGEPYARDTRGEIAELRGRKMLDRSLRFVLGAEEGFSGLGVIERIFKARIPDFTIHRTLDEVVRNAAQYAKTPSFAERVTA